MKGAKVAGDPVGQYIHITVSDEVKKAIYQIGKDAVNKNDNYYDIQQQIRHTVKSKYGGVWICIVTEASDYDSNWDHNFNMNLALEFDIGMLRVYLYQENVGTTTNTTTF